MNSPIVEICTPQRLNVLGGNAGWISGQSDRISQQDPVLFGQPLAVESDCRKIVNQPLITSQLTEPRSVVRQSIMTLIESRHHHGDHLTLHSAQGGRTMHGCPVHFVVGPEDRGADSMNPDDVVGIQAPLVGWDIGDVGHGAILQRRTDTFKLLQNSTSSLRLTFGLPIMDTTG